MGDQKAAETQFELSTDLYNLEQLEETDLSPYDAFYLGNPYCLLHKGNFLLSREDTCRAADALRRAGKKIYLTTPTAPRGEELLRVEGIFGIAREIEADGVEHHNLGMVYKASRELPEIPSHAGVFANIYTQVAASLLAEYGVVRVRPNVEVSLDEMEIIQRESPVAVSITLHGKIPLGIVADCFLLEEGKESESCPEACLVPAWLKARDWTIMHVGRGIYSGLDQCLVEHLDRIVAKGFRCFRIEAGYENGTYRNGVGKVYREGIESALSGSFSARTGWRETLKVHTRLGFCNGYLFGRSGRVYIGGGGEISR